MITTMEKANPVSVSARDVSGQKRATAAAPPDATVGEFAQALISEMNLPQTDVEGRPMSYHVLLPARRAPSAPRGDSRRRAADGRRDRAAAEDPGGRRLNARRRLSLRQELGGQAHVRRCSPAPVRPGNLQEGRPAPTPGHLRNHAGLGAGAGVGAVLRDVPRPVPSVCPGGQPRSDRAALARAGRHAARGRRPGDYSARRTAAGCMRYSAWVLRRRGPRGILGLGRKRQARGGRVVRVPGVCLRVRRPGGRARSRTARVFTIKPVKQVLDVRDVIMDGFLAASSPCGSTDDEQIAVFMPREMIEETVQRMVRAGGEETGGILIGHLHRDPGRRQLFLEVTAQIPAQHAEQELARLTFTPETWTAVDAALALRGKGEIQLGWWHSHPASHWCDDCPPDTRGAVRPPVRLRATFSARTTWPCIVPCFRGHTALPWCSATVAAVPAAPTWRLFGWRYGMVMARGFHLLDTAEPPAAAAVQLGGEANVPS